MKKAFTLIELLMVISIIAIIAALIVPPIARRITPNKPLPKPATTVVTTERAYDYYIGASVYEFTYDGCQYIGVGSSSIAHKGNCTNSIHVYHIPLEK